MSSKLPHHSEYDITALEGGDSLDQRSMEIPSIEELQQEQARRKLLYYYDCENLIKDGDAEVSRHH